MDPGRLFDTPELDLRKLEYFLRCPCGQVHIGGRPDLSRDVHSIDCSICGQPVEWDLSHVGRRPRKLRPLTRDNLSFMATEHDLLDAPIDIMPSAMIDGVRSWRVRPTGRAWSFGEGLVVVFDARGHLIHLGKYCSGWLVRGMYLDQASGFVHYVSRTRRMTYERGALESHVAPAFVVGNSIVLVDVRYRKWLRAFMKLILAAPRPRRRQTLCMTPH